MRIPRCSGGRPPRAWLLPGLLTALLLALGGCLADQPDPLNTIHRQLERAGSSNPSPSISGRRRLAVIRQRDGRTELVLHRLDGAASEPIAISPAGVPEQLALSADGHQLAVQVSREGRSQIDLITLP